MDNIFMIIGKSGSGKSHAMKNLDPERTLIVNVCGKRFPFQNKFKYTFKSKNIEVVKDQLRKMPGNIKTVVIDDFGYVMTDMFMRGHTGGDQFKLYNAIGDTVYSFFTFLQDELPDDVTVYIIMHEEENDSGSIKPRTIGKLLDQKVCLEGMVTICMRAITTRDGSHMFRVQSDGYDVAKSPEGMFETDEIPNDLAMIDKRIREFWGITDIPAKPTNSASDSSQGTVTTTTAVPPTTGKTADKKAS